MSMTEVSTVMEGKRSNHAAVMKRLINDKEFSNVMFEIGPKAEVIFAHQGILAAHCPVFKAMFLDASHDEDCKHFCLKDMMPNIFLAMLEYIYTNSVTLNPSIAVDVLAASLEYGLDDLRDLCVAYMVNNLTAKTACDVMQAAVTYNQNDLKATAMTYVENNTQEILKAENFKDLSEDALVTIASSDKLNIDELELITAVKQWASVNAAVNGMKQDDIAQEVMKQLRLPLLSSDELMELEEDNKKNSFIPIQNFQQAWQILKKVETEMFVYARRKGTTHRDHHKNFGN